MPFIEQKKLTCLALRLRSIDYWISTSQVLAMTFIINQYNQTPL